MKNQLLGQGEVHAMRAKTGQHLCCEHGILWLTCEGETTDTILHAGQSAKISRSGKIVLQALQAGSYTLTAPKRGLNQRDFWRWLRSRRHASPIFTA